MEHIINELFGGIAPQEIINYAQTNQDLDEQELKDYITRYKNTHIEIDGKWYPVVPIMSVAKLTDNGFFYATANTCKTNIDLESYFMKSYEIESLQATEDIIDLPQYENLKNKLWQNYTANFSSTDFIPENDKNEILYSFFIGKEDYDAYDLAKLKNSEKNSIRNRFLKNTKFKREKLPIHQVNDDANHTNLDLPTLIPGTARKSNESNENQKEWQQRPSMINMVKNFHYILNKPKAVLLNSINNEVFDNSSNSEKEYFVKAPESNYYTISNELKNDLLTFFQSNYPNVNQSELTSKINEIQTKLPDCWYDENDKDDIKNYIANELTCFILGINNLPLDINELVNNSGILESANNYFHLIQATMTATMIILLNKPRQTRKNIWKNYSQFINNLMLSTEDFTQIMENDQDCNINKPIDYMVSKFLGSSNINQDTKKNIHSLSLLIHDILSHADHVTNLNYLIFKENRYLKDGFIHNGHFCVPLYDFCKQNEIDTTGLDQPPENYILTTHTFSQNTLKKRYEIIGNPKRRIPAGISTILGTISLGVGIAFLLFPGLNFLSPFLMAGGGALITAGAATFGYDEYQMHKKNNLNNNNQNTLIPDQTETQREIPASSPNIAPNTNSRIQSPPGLFPPNFDINGSFNFSREQLNWIMNNPNYTWVNEQTQRARTGSMTANLLQQQQANQQPRRRVGGEQLH